MLYSTVWFNVINFFPSFSLVLYRQPSQPLACCYVFYLSWFSKVCLFWFCFYSIVYVYRYIWVFIRASIREGRIVINFQLNKIFNGCIKSTLLYSTLFVCLNSSTLSLYIRDSLHYYYIVCSFLIYNHTWVYHSSFNSNEYTTTLGLI